MPILLIVALLGTVVAAQAIGKWSVSGRDTVDITKLAPADLKGWMTLQQVVDGLGISQSELYAIGNIPAETAPTTALKDMEAVVSVTTLRDKLTARFAAPSSSANAAPTQAVVATSTALAQITATHATPTPLVTGQILPADLIKGKMTLREVSQQCAVPLDKLLAALKMSDINPDTAIKDLIAQSKLVDVTDVQKVVVTLQK
jgi:hypothetical protein